MLDLTEFDRQLYREVLRLPGAGPDGWTRSMGVTAEWVPERLRRLAGTGLLTWEPERTRDLRGQGRRSAHGAARGTAGAR